MCAIGAYSPPGKITFSALFCRNSSAPLISDSQPGMSDWAGVLEVLSYSLTLIRSSATAKLIETGRQLSSSVKEMKSHGGRHLHGDICFIPMDTPSPPLYLRTHSIPSFLTPSPSYMSPGRNRKCWPVPPYSVLLCKRLAVSVLQY